jgi:flavin reductase (DIM6/NTAB) family NADH-FMN oxidoreductase RutF
MQLDPSILSHADNYKLLTNLVVPRPIAWVSTQSTDGVVNLAPFSFFNVVGSNPPYIIISISENEGQPKDTARNILDSGAFVVNLVTEDLFDAMNISAADFPSEQSELEAGKLHTAPSVQIKAPRVAEAQASLECKLFSVQPLGANTLFIGEVVMYHIADQLMGPRLHINNFSPIGRLGSPSLYSRTTDRMDLARISYAQWSSKQT